MTAEAIPTETLRTTLPAIKTQYCVPIVDRAWIREPMIPMAARRRKDFFRPYFSLTQGATMQPIMIPAVPRPVPALCSLEERPIVVTPVAGLVVAVLPNWSLK
jgi:hypothetical protein